MFIIYYNVLNLLTSVVFGSLVTVGIISYYLTRNNEIHTLFKMFLKFQLIYVLYSYTHIVIYMKDDSLSMLIPYFFFNNVVIENSIFGIFKFT